MARRGPLLDVRRLRSKCHPVDLAQPGRVVALREVVGMARGSIDTRRSALHGCRTCRRGMQHGAPADRLRVMTPTMRDFLSVPDAAREMIVSRSTMYRMIREDKVAACRHGSGAGRLVVPRDEIERYVRELRESAR